MTLAHWGGRETHEPQRKQKGGPQWGYKQMRYMTNHIKQLKWRNREWRYMTNSSRNMWNTNRISKSFQQNNSNLEISNAWLPSPSLHHWILRYFGSCLQCHGVIKHGLDIFEKYGGRDFAWSCFIGGRYFSSLFCFLQSLRAFYSHDFLESFAILRSIPPLFESSFPVRSRWGRYIIWICPHYSREMSQMRSHHIPIWFMS